MTIGVPAYEQLIDILREEILSGIIPADTRLTILGVAKRFSVSQMPVREAFQRLQGEGLIKGTPHKGARVISIDDRFIRHIYEVRGVMEGLLACSGFSAITAGTIEALESINQKISEASDKGETDEILSLDHQFHIKIYEHSQNTVALDIYNNFTRLLSKLRCRYGFGTYRLHELTQQHETILNFFRTGDREKIEYTVRAHRIGSMEDLLAQMSMDQQIRKGGDHVSSNSI